MRFKYLGFSALGAAMLLTSCASVPTNVAYFQDAVDNGTVPVAQAMEIRVKPEDKLSIVVSTQDPAISQLFNLVVTENRMQMVGGKAGSGVQWGASSGLTALYTVNARGDIQFPLLGNLHVGGMRRGEVAEYIADQLAGRDLVKDPIVTVEFANTGLSIMGEVKQPGRYGFNRDRLNILDALAMAGDLQPNAQRENILVMREEGGVRKTYRLDLTDMKSVAASPAFWLQQEDIVYVEPNDKAKRETTPNGNTLMTPGFWMGVGSFGLALTSVVITIVR